MQAMTASPSATSAVPALRTSSADLETQLRMIHGLITARFSQVDRVAVVLYDAVSGMLKTFVSSTVGDDTLKNYEVPLSQVPSLQALAESRRSRVVGDIAEAFGAPTEHTRWLKHQDYRASVTSPVFQGDTLAGFLFYDSKTPHAFSDEHADLLHDFSELISHLFLMQRRLVHGVVSTIQVAVDLARTRDFETGQHLERIAYYSRIMARALAPVYGLSDEYVEYVQLFAPLHDIGKVGIPDHILLKPGRLDAAEYEVMKRHVPLGLDIIQRISTDLGLKGSFQEQVMCNIVSTHHERGDGSGYPQGLTMEQIPLEGRIVAVADVYDALSNRRAYKNSWDDAHVCAELRAEVVAGQLDEDCVEALLEAKEARMAIKLRFADAREPGDYA